MSDDLLEAYEGEVPDASEQEFVFVNEPEDPVVNTFFRGQSAVEIRQEGRRGAWIATDSPMEIEQ